MNLACDGSGVLGLAFIDHGALSDIGIFFDAQTIVRPPSILTFALQQALDIGKILGMTAQMQSVSLANRVDQRVSQLLQVSHSHMNIGSHDALCNRYGHLYHLRARMIRNVLPVTCQTLTLLSKTVHMWRKQIIRHPAGVLSTGFKAIVVPAPSGLLQLVVVIRCTVLRYRIGP